MPSKSLAPSAFQLRSRPHTTLMYSRSSPSTLRLCRTKCARKIRLDLDYVYKVAILQSLVRLATTKGWEDNSRGTNFLLHGRCNLSDTDNGIRQMST